MRNDMYVNKKKIQFGKKLKDEFFEKNKFSANGYSKRYQSDTERPN
jgi:hypothetical protein